MKKTISAIITIILVSTAMSPAWAVPIGNDVEYIPTPRNLGVNIIAPLAKLDVNGQVLIRGGSPAAGRVLTSDALGLATWQAVAATTNATNAINLTGGGTITNTNFASSTTMLSNTDIVFQGAGPDAGDIVFVNGSGNEKARIYSDTNATNGLAFSVGAASPEVYLNEDGNLGINTLTPTEKLEIAGNVKATKFFGIFNGDGSELRNIPASAITGGGVPSSTDAINLTGGGTITSTEFTNSTAIRDGGNLTFKGTGPDAGDIVFVNGTGNEKARIYSDTNATNGLAFSVGAASPEVYLNEDGNLGINTVTPFEKLQVNGNVMAHFFKGDGSLLTNIPASAITGTINNVTVNNSTINNPTINDGTTTNQTINNPTINDGTTNNQTLNNPTINNATINNATITGDGSGLTGIGNATNAVNLTGGGTITSTEFNNSTAIRSGGDMVLRAANTDPGDLVFTELSGEEKARIYTDSTTNNGLYLSVNNALPAELVIAQSGNVGIGKDSATEKLEVVGNVKATSFIGSFSGDGSGLTNVTATTVTGGTVNNTTVNNSTITGGTSTNQTINNPTINDGTTNNQTINNATINSPTINNATITGDGSGLTGIGSATNAVNLTGGGTITSTNFTNSTTMLSGADVVFQGVGPDAGDIVFVNGTGNEKARIYSDTNATNGLALSVGAASPEVYLNQDGNLGINTVTPFEKLQVNGNVMAHFFKGDGSQLTNITATTVAPSSTINNVTINNSTITGGTSTNQTINNPTINDGTTNNQTLNNPTINNATINNATITGDGSGLTGVNAVNLTGGGTITSTEFTNSTAIRSGGDMVLRAANTDPGDLVFTELSGEEKARIYSSNSSANGLFLSVNGASPAELVIAQTGNVGIGKDVATEKLEVVGNVKATSFIGSFSGDGSGLTNVTATTVTGGTVNNTTVTNSTINNPTINDGTTTNQTINNPTINDGTTTNQTINNPTINDGTTTNQTINNPTISGGTTSNQTINNATLTGTTTVTGPITSNSTINTTSTVTANAFSGDGSQLTNINGAAVSTVPNATNAANATNAVNATTAGSATNAVNLTGGGTITSTEFATSTAIRGGGDLVFKGAGNDAGDIVFLNGAGNEKARIYSDTNATNGLALSVGAASPEVYLNTSGNLGVNTLVPTEKLHVVGNVKASNFIGNGTGLTNIPASAFSATPIYDSGWFQVAKNSYYTVNHGLTSIPSNVTVLFKPFFNSTSVYFATPLDKDAGVGYILRMTSTSFDMTTGNKNVGLYHAGNTNIDKAEGGYYRIIVGGSIPFN